MRPDILRLGALVFLVAACGLGQESPPVTTAPTATTITSSTTAPLTVGQAAAEFRSCLTGQGLSVPDLPLDEEGRPDLAALANVIDPNSAEWRDGLTACAGVIVANGFLDLSADPELGAAVVARLMAFSACMRSHGVEAFPDPPSDFDGTTPPFPLGVIPADDPDLPTAAEACALTVAAEPSG